MIRNIKTYTGFILESIQRRGFVFTIKLILWELLFDTFYKVDTFSIAELDTLGLDEKSVAHGRRYQASNYYLLIHAFKKIKELMEEQWKQSSLIDIGSGKGRVLLLGALEGIPRLTGLEIADDLNRVARRNIQTMAKKKNVSVDQFELITGDAASTPIPDHVTIVYLANPFDDTIMNEVLNQIEMTAERHPREILIVYMTPLHSEVFKGDRYEQIFSFNEDYIIFKRES